MEAGGSITGEHGVGVDKKRYMPDQFEEPDLAAFQRLRCAFDPDGLANPGKVMPTPRLCGEVPGPYRAAPAGGGGAGGADVTAAGRRAGLRRLARVAQRTPVRSVGSGTKLHWGVPGDDGVEHISTAGLDRLLEHNEGDLTAIVEAGLPLAEAQAAFAEARPGAAARPARPRRRGHASAA